MSLPCACRAALLALLLSTPAAAGEEQLPDAGAVARRLFDAFNRHDLEALVALYAKDAVLVSPDHSSPLHGPEGVRAIYAPLFASFPDARDEVVATLVQGNRVAVEFLARGCAGAGQGCYAIPIASFLTTRDGLIVEDRSYFDVPAASSQEHCRRRTE